MLTENLFRTLPARPDTAAAALVPIEFDGQVMQVPAGVTLAAALLAAGVDRFRTSAVSQAPRAPYCMMGVCFECLVEIDGKPSQQSCLTTVRAGMKVRSMEGARALELALTGENDGR